MNVPSEAPNDRASQVLRIPNGHGHVFELEVTDIARSRDELISTYWALHPRYAFFKSVVKDCVLLDVGAGSGGLAVWKSWGSPSRQDIELSALELTRGEMFDHYVDFELIDASRNRTKFADATFDAAVASHVIEHVADLRGLMAELKRILKPGAKIYIEWPHPASAKLPSSKVLSVQGITASTINFFDDSTHVNVLQPDQVKDRLQQHDFNVLSCGMIMNDGLAPELLSFGFQNSDAEVTTYGIWLLLGFSTYIIAERQAKRM